MASQDEGTEFTISCTGEKTGETYIGKFKAKRFLSHRDRVMQDRIYRELLGVRPEDASQDAIAYAVMLSQCRVRILEAASWWKDADNGLDLRDNKPLEEVCEKVVAIETEAIKSVQEKAEAAKKQLEGSNPPA